MRVTRTQLGALMMLLFFTFACKAGQVAGAVLVASAATIRVAAAAAEIAAAERARHEAEQARAHADARAQEAAMAKQRCVELHPEPDPTGAQPRTVLCGSQVMVQHPITGRWTLYEHRGGAAVVVMPDHRIMY